MRCWRPKETRSAVLIIPFKRVHVLTFPSSLVFFFLFTLNLMTFTSVGGQYFCLSHLLLHPPTSSLYLQYNPPPLVSAHCPRPVPKCSSFIFVFICQISEALVPLHTTPQNIKLESLPNPGRSMDKGWQA